VTFINNLSYKDRLEGVLRTASGTMKEWT